MSELTQTFTVLVNKVRARLEDRPNPTRVTASYAASGAVTVSLADGGKVGAETPIENITTKEVLFAESVSTNDVTVNLEGRGYEGTTAAAGNSGDIVLIGAKHKTIDIEAAINVAYNDWITAFFPRLVWDTTTAGYADAEDRIYAAPAVALSVETVGYHPRGDEITFTDLTQYAEPLLYLPTQLVSTGRGFKLRVRPKLPRTSSADGGITATDKTLTSATAAFTANDVGQYVSIPGAGAAGATLVTYITTYTSATEVEVNTAASTTVTTATLKIGPAIWVLVKQPWTFLEAAGDTVPADFPVQGVDLIVDGAALYLAGWKTLPKTHLSEVAFQRDSGENPNLAPLRLASQEWAKRAKQVASNYNALAAGASPSRIWIS